MEEIRLGGVVVRSSRDDRSSALVAGTLIGVFQLVGRTQAGQLVPLGGGSPLGELRLWVMVVLSLWLLAAAAVVGPRIDRFKIGEARRSGRVITLFVMYMIATTLWAPDVVRAQQKAYDLLFVAWSCGLTVASVGLFGYRATLEGFWFSLFGLGFVLAGAGLLSDSSSGYEGRVAAFGGGPNVFGRNMGLFTLAALWCVSNDRRWLKKPALVMAPLGVLLVFLSGSRGAMLALFAGLIVYLVLQGWDRRVVRSMILTVLIGVAFLTTQVGRFAVWMFQERFIVLLLAERYFTHRDTLLVDGITAGLQHPLGGLGLGGFGQVGSKGEYPHNMFVEAFAEGGALGVGLLCIPFIAYARRWRVGMGSGDAIALAGLVLLLISSSISGDLFDARGVFLVLLMTLASQEGVRPDRKHMMGVDCRRIYAKRVRFKERK